MTHNRVGNAPEPLPRLYALHRDDDEDGPPTVVAWGLAFADGSAVTLWADPYPGAAIAVSESVRNVEKLYARYVDAYLVWLTGTPSDLRSLPLRSRARRHSV